MSGLNVESKAGAMGLYDWYEPSPDGKRFLVISTVSAASPITIVLNWKPPEG